MNKINKGEYYVQNMPMESVGLTLSNSPTSAIISWHQNRLQLPSYQDPPSSVIVAERIHDRRWEKTTTSSHSAQRVQTEGQPGFAVTTSGASPGKSTVNSWVNCYGSTCGSTQHLALVQVHSNIFGPDSTQ